MTEVAVRTVVPVEITMAVAVSAKVAPVICVSGVWVPIVAGLYNQATGRRLTRRDRSDASSDYNGRDQGM